MAELLEGGCRVATLREGHPQRSGNLSVYSHAGRALGAQAISLRILEFAAGRSPELRNAVDEVLFVLEGQGTLFLDGTAHSVGPETGVYIAPGVTFAVECAAPLVVAGSRCPDPGDVPLYAGAPMPHAPPAPPVRLADQQARPTADRWYRTMIDAIVTQFVGGIPPGRAPDHYHHYEEVLCILRGRGRMWAGETNAPIAAGSCIYLPRGQIHCVENTGDGELVLLGCFYPAGSPAVRYYEKETP
jgi:mannose-6-phosphate isomerase-like protein (cupin superfamily)